MSDKKKPDTFGMTIPMGFIRRFVKKMENLDDSDPISFELIMASFFPKAWQNVQKYANGCYAKGYVDGKAAANNEKEKEV